MSQMIEMSAGDLPEAALDWLITGIEHPEEPEMPTIRYSADWRHGGPLIDRHNVTVRALWNGGQRRTGTDACRADIDFLSGRMRLGDLSAYGETALIAACRVIVMANLGEKVQVPANVLNPEPREEPVLSDLQRAMCAVGLPSDADSGRLVQAIEDLHLQAAEPRASMEYPHFNSPSTLPPVDCPILIKVKRRVYRVMRPGFVENKSSNLCYRLENGRVLTGRFPWTYP